MIIRGLFRDYFNTTALPAIDARLIKRLKAKRRAALMPRILKILSSDRDIEQSAGHTGIGQFKLIPEGGAVERDQPLPIPSKTFTHERFGLSVLCSRDAIEDDKFGLVTDMAEALADSEVDTREMQAASIYNDGFSANGYDGVPLYSANHPLHYRGGVQSNVLTVAMALSHTALEEAGIQMFGMVDDTGKPISVMARKLIIPYQLMFKAPEILRGSMRSDTANNTVNVLNAMEGGLPEPMVWRYLTSATRWFLQDNDANVIWYNRRAPYSSSWVDDPTESGHRARRYRASYGHSNYIGTFASNPS